MTKTDYNTQLISMEVLFYSAGHETSHLIAVRLRYLGIQVF